MWSSTGYGDVCVDFHYLYMPAEVTVSIMEKDKDVSSVSKVMESSGCIKATAPKDCVTNTYELVVKVQSTFYNYSSAKKPTFIHCDKLKSITFIQTDKPIYKAGQKVRFRILTVSLPKLTPVVEDIDRVYMETPGATRILQNDNVTTTLGLAELDFQLDTYPPLGTWKIFVENSAGKHTKEFKVDEFVLPKWSVTIEAPATAVPWGTATFKICAKYTYGEAVQGNYTAHISTTYWNINDVVDTVSFSGQINEDSSGCVTLSVNASTLRGFSGWKYLSANVSVTEIVSGITRTATSRKVRIISWYSAIRFDHEMPPYFKPGLPIPGRVFISTASQSASDIEVTIQLITYQTRRFIWNSRTSRSNRVILYSTTKCTDENGSVQFLIPTDNIPKNTTRVQLKVTTKDFTSHRYLRAWYSESNHFVTIVPPFKSVPCTGSFSFRIYHNTEVGTPLRYMIISKGVVLQTGTEYIPGTFPFSFHLFDIEKENYFDMELTMTPLMSGETTMLVYYVTPSLEFIADFVRFDVDECFSNEVTFEFDKDKGQPGEDVTYTLSSASDSLCGIGVIDRSLEILAGNSFILKKQVFNILKKMTLRYTTWQFGTREYCRKYFERIRKQERRDDSSLSASCYYRLKYIDSSVALNSIGVYAMSDLVIQTSPCEYYCYSCPSCSRSHGVRYTVGPEEEDVSMENSNENDASTEEEDEIVDVRKYFPEAFLWKLVVVPKSGSVSQTATLPDTITEWYGNAVCTNEDVGMGISEFASVTTFQTFFLQLNLPYSIIRGETVHIPVIIFNYLDQDECLAVNIKMSEQSTFSLEGTNEFTVCSCGQHSVSVEYIITPNIIGEIDLTVIAITTQNRSVCKQPLSQTTASDGVSRKLLVKPEGIEVSYSFVRFLCSPASLSTELPLPDQYVEGSERGEISVIGDVMGPALSNMDGLIRMPFGCGEQTIFLTGQATIVLRYLEATGQATPEIRSKAIRSMSSGYQRELTFKYPNGAYSAWGTRDYRNPNGSNWLTAYVMRVFALSDKYIFIDPREQEVSMAFLESTQDKDGCFPQVGLIGHKNMQGGLIGGNRPIALTAFILISLLEAGRSPTSQSVVSAIGCLSNPNPEDMSTYALALSAYAYSLYGQDSARRQQIMNELDKRAIADDGQKYWSELAVTPNPYCRWYCPNPSYDVEMTAYVLLAVLTAGGMDIIGEGLPIVKWLTSQRNAYGGWSSTQDTFVGLSALSKYSTYRAGDAVDVSVIITPPGVTFHIDSNNKQLLQTSPIDVPTNISINVSGEGCAVVQANVWYNIVPPLPKKPFFSIELKIVPTNQCERQILDMCASYLHDDGPTNMALVQVKMVTGWEVDKDSLPQPLQANTNITESEDSAGLLTKIEFDNDIVTFYFNELTSAASCFKFQVTQEIKVNNVRPGFVIVFDYYNTNKKTGVEYTLSCD